jgi:hypothetical protein
MLQNGKGISETFKTALLKYNSGRQNISNISKTLKIYDIAKYFRTHKETG